jgi:DNA-binding NtrC family response regulator
LPATSDALKMAADPDGSMRKTKSARHDPTRGASVFVVDDNALLVKLAATVLEQAGYLVASFSEPKAVLRAMESADPKPAVLVTDFDMAEMNGLELIESSHKIHPALKTILLSGSIDGSTVFTPTAKVNRFLGKPYEPWQLQNMVAKLVVV